MSNINTQYLSTSVSSMALSTFEAGAIIRLILWMSKLRSMGIFLGLQLFKIFSASHTQYAFPLLLKSLPPFSLTPTSPLIRHPQILLLCSLSSKLPGYGFFWCFAFYFAGVYRKSFRVAVIFRLNAYCNRKEQMEGRAVHIPAKAFAVGNVSRFSKKKENRTGCQKPGSSPNSLKTGWH